MDNINEKQIESEIKTASAQKLYQAVADLKNPQEAALLLRDLFTLDELNEAIARFKAARMLNRGIAYRTVADEIGISTGTVARVAYWLNHGTGGYRLALKRLKN